MPLSKISESNLHTQSGHLHMSMHHIRQAVLFFPHWHLDHILKIILEQSRQSLGTPLLSARWNHSCFPVYPKASNRPRRYSFGSRGWAFALAAENKSCITRSNAELQRPGLWNSRSKAPDFVWQLSSEDLEMLTIKPHNLCEKGRALCKWIMWERRGPRTKVGARKGFSFWQHFFKVLQRGVPFCKRRKQTPFNYCIKNQSEKWQNS